MDEPLHPSNLGEILDRTAQLYRSRFLVLLGISVVPTVAVLAPAFVLFLLLAWLGSNSSSPAPPAGAKSAAEVVLAVMGLAVALAFLAGTALADAAMNHAVSRAYLGEKPTIRDAYKTAWRRGWRYIWLYLLEGLIVWVAPIAAWIVVVVPLAAWSDGAGAGASANALFGLAALLSVAALAAYALWMLLRLSLAFPACVIEQIRAWPALKRSTSLTQGTRGRIFLLYLLAVVLTWLLSFGVTVPLAIVGALLPGAGSPQFAQTAGVIVILILYGAAFAVQALIRPVYGIALTLFYYDQRIRQEGFDIEWMMQRAGLAVPPPPTPENAPWLPETPPGAQPPATEPPPSEELPQSPQPPSLPPGESQ